MNIKFHREATLNFGIYRQRGFSLVELMVAMVLGIFLSTAVAVGYLSTKRTYSTTQQVARIQENSRFALHFLGANLRNSGNLGCVDHVRNHVNDSLYDVTKPIMGWNYDNTNANDTYVIPSNNTPVGAALNTWSQTKGADNDLPVILQNRVMPGTDVVLTQGFSALQDIVLKNNNVISQHTLVTETAHNLAAGTILIVSDCLDSADRYQSNSNGNSKSLARSQAHQNPGNVKLKGAKPWAREYGAESNIYVDISTFYYVGLGASGLPSLFSLPIGVEGTTATPIELVEGVENMQLIYGEDIDDDSTIDNYVSADEIADWGNVISVRLGLLMRSIEDNPNDSTRNDTYILADNINLTHATGADDQVLRYPIQTTIRLRNSGNFQSITSCPAADGDECT